MRTPFVFSGNTMDALSLFWDVFHVYCLLVGVMLTWYGGLYWVMQRAAMQQQEEIAQEKRQHEYD